MIEISEIIDLLNPEYFRGNEQSEVSEIVQLGTQKGEANELLWCADKNANKLANLTKGTVIISTETFLQIPKINTSSSINWIAVKNPRSAFLKIVKHFFYKQNDSRIIHPTAQIHVSVRIDKNSVAIGHNVVVEENVTIGNNVTIGHNTVILAHTHIGNHVSIGNNTTIGGVGFGYEKDENGEYELIPHIGNVVIEDFAEIGNNVAIDRGVLGSTRIGKNVKIDNLVHIAHGVDIGENSLVIANSMIAGSVKIGKNVWVGPSTSTIQNISIGDGVLTGVASNVIKNVEPDAVMVGNPAKKIR